MSNVLSFVCRNAPNVHASSKLPNPDGWHGAQLSVTIEGNWSSYRSKVLKYLRQIAVITPYAQVGVLYPAQSKCHWLASAQVVTELAMIIGETRGTGCEGTCQPTV